eukprot:747015-Pelagomonas_calceolata.AAC.1
MLICAPQLVMSHDWITPLYGFIWVPYCMLPDFPCSDQHLLLTFMSCRAKLDGPYDSRALPIMLSGLLLLSLGVVFSGALVRLMDPTGF